MADLTVSSAVDTFLSAPTQAEMRDALNLSQFYSTPISLTYGASLTPDCNDGLYRKVVMTGNPTLNAPTNGSDGMKWKCRFTASGADRTLTIHAGIKVPSESTFAGTQVITSGETWIVQLEHNGTAWMLQTLIGGWA